MIPKNKRPLSGFAASEKGKEEERDARAAGQSLGRKEMDSLPVLLAIDPSVKYLGWACCNLFRAGANTTVKVGATGCFIREA